MTLLAAIITATVALLVVIVDRVVVGTVERRGAEGAARRQIYAEFISAARMTGYHISSALQHTEPSIAAAERMSRQHAEIMLVATRPVIDAADAVIDALTEWSSEPTNKWPTEAHEALDNFTQRARAEKVRWRN